MFGILLFFAKRFGIEQYVFETRLFLFWQPSFSKRLFTWGFISFKMNMVLQCHSFKITIPELQTTEMSFILVLKRQKWNLFWKFEALAQCNFHFGMKWNHSCLVHFSAQESKNPLRENFIYSGKRKLFLRFRKLKTWENLYFLKRKLFLYLGEMETKKPEKISYIFSRESFSYI